MRSSKSSFTIKLLGGLGNQLHGMAAGYAIGGSTGLTPIFDASDVPWGSNASRKLEVNKFTWPEVSGTSGQIRIKKPYFSPIRNGPHQRIAARTRDKFKKSEKLFTSDRFRDRDSILEAARNGFILSGYFNDFEWITSAFDFGFPSVLQLRRSKTQNLHDSYNALHIRLSDYLWHPDLYPLVTEAYLLAGIEHLKSDLPLYIFTDDVTLSRQRFPRVCGSALEVIGPKKMGTIDSFLALSQAKNLVTANSTFSSWAGIFVEKKGGKVIAPGTMNYAATEDFRPASWIKLSIFDGSVL